MVCKLQLCSATCIANKHRWLNFACGRYWNGHLKKRRRANFWLVAPGVCHHVAPLPLFAARPQVAQAFYRQLFEHLALRLHEGAFKTSSYVCISDDSVCQDLPILTQLVVHFPRHGPLCELVSIFSNFQPNLAHRSGKAVQCERIHCGTCDRARRARMKPCQVPLRHSGSLWV